jgi:hypothetical protein
MIGPDSPSYHERGIGLLVAGTVVVTFRVIGGLPEFVVGMLLTFVAGMLAAVLMDEQSWSGRSRRRALFVVFLSAIGSLILR